MSIHQNKKASNLNCSNSSYDSQLQRNKASLSLNSPRTQKATDNSNISAELVESEQTQPKVKALKILLSNENVSLYPTSVNSHLISEIALKSDALKRLPNMMLSDNLKSFLFTPFYLNTDESAFTFSSDSYPSDWIDSSYAIKKVLIFQGNHFNRLSWDYTFLSGLLNEFLMFNNLPKRETNKFCFVH